MMRALLIILLILKINIPSANAVDIDRLIHDSIEEFKKVSDYTCILDKTVNKKGTVYKDLNICVKYMKPRHYYFRWDQGKFEGQEVIFVSGSYNDKIVAHPGGIFRFFTLRLDPEGPLAMKRNHHSLNNSGMEKVMERIEDNYNLHKKTGLGLIRYGGEDNIHGRDVWIINGVFPQDYGFNAHKIEICFDKQIKLPVKVSAYDWSNNLVEEYIFRDLKINVGLKKEDFNPENPEYGYF